MEVSTVKLFHTDKTNKYYISILLNWSVVLTGLGFGYWFTATRVILLELTVGAQVTGVTLQWAGGEGEERGYSAGEEGKPKRVEEGKGKVILCTS
jgi:hypothetical protein